MSLLGKWVVDYSDFLTRQQLGEVEMEFCENGDLIYKIIDGMRLQTIKLRYRIEGSTIISDQPSAPREERTEFSLSANNVLTLTYGGVNCRFVRYEKE